MVLEKLFVLTAFWGQTEVRRVKTTVQVDIPLSPFNGEPQMAKYLLSQFAVSEVVQVAFVC